MSESPRPPSPEKKMARKKLSRVSVLKRDVMACIPSNWCDDLLTGKRGIKVPAGCPEIERLLNNIRADVDAAFARHER